MKILHISSSPRGARSVTLDVAHHLLDALTTRHPGSTVDTMDVWSMDLPPFDGAALEAKYADLSGEQMSPEQTAIWTQIRALGDRFHAADLLVFSVPMWNYGIPYRLKHLIDAVSQRGILFNFDQNGQSGLLNGRKMVTVAARGAELPAPDFEHQVSYMNTWAKMVGITETHTLLATKTLMGPEADKQARTEATKQAEALAATL